MNRPRWLCLLLLIPLMTLAAMTGCADTAKDASGFSNDERLDAMQRGVVLPGMTASQVTTLWGPPGNKKATVGGEEWTYNSGPMGAGYDVLTAGKVNDIINGDLMAGRRREE